ncbi:MAG TPA: hypothetical protein VN580_00185 [Clostridia bacterium]|nr:hypothetical protein [Clostridia bacterium]
MKKRIIVLTLALIMCLSMIFVYGNDELMQDDEDQISPEAVTEHACHSGPEHRRYDTVIHPRPCDCIYVTYECCCGRTMGYIVYPCEEHAYDRASSDGIHMTLSDDADLTKEEEQRIVETIIQTQAELHKASQNPGEDVSEEAARKLLEKSKWFEDRIKELQRNRK